MSSSKKVNKINDLNDLELSTRSMNTEELKEESSMISCMINVKSVLSICVSLSLSIDQCLQPCRCVYPSIREGVHWSILLLRKKKKIKRERLAASKTWRLTVVQRERELEG